MDIKTIEQMDRQTDWTGKNNGYISKKDAWIEKLTDRKIQMTWKTQWW